MDVEDERLLDFRMEAKRSLEEVSFAVKHGVLSSSLPSNSQCAYFNLTVSEGTQYTVRLCMKGFEVVGRDHDKRDLENATERNTEPVFETVYALLNHLSPSYQLNFHHAVSDKLAKVKAASFD